MKRVAVIGAGTMGHGVAQVAALAGFDTSLTDARPEALEPALERIRANLAKGVDRGKVDTDAADDALRRLRLAQALDDTVERADLVIEAVVEDLEVKRALFAQLDQL
ncbi:MAG: 3-hydroxyacyl-CoA dehydrogenase NAD-binding domain-containing protein, partial [Gemmatimonadales bacterium]